MVFKIFKKKEIKLQQDIFKIPIQKGLTEDLILLNRLYFYCNNIEKIRNLYTDLLKLNEIIYKNNDDEKYLVYQTGNVQIMWLESSEKQPIKQEWAVQPGYLSGPNEQNSYAICYPNEKYITIVKKIKQSNVKMLNEQSELRQNNDYWGFTIMDDMGNTIELYTENTNKD